MPYDAKLAERVRQTLSGSPGLTEIEMFGGRAFMLHGHMCVCVWKECLIARVGKDVYKELLAEPGASVFDITGNPMPGWILVDPIGTEFDDDLSRWINAALTFVKTLPPR